MSHSPLELLAGLPGEDWIIEGLDDFQGGRHTIPACLVRMAQPRLSRVGLMTDSIPRDDSAELELYQLLASEGQRAYSRYNSLVRELVSFEHALDHRFSRLHRKSMQRD